MKTLIQRVSSASVAVGGQNIGSIGKGYLIFLGISPSDDVKTVHKMVDKISKLRIFEDKEGKTNLSIKDVNGEVLVVSQFTLYADCAKGNRPGFERAAKPAHAQELYSQFLSRCKETFVKVQQGIFGAEMEVQLVNSGPFTILLEI